MAQSFSSIVKEELLHQPEQARHCSIAEIAAMVSMSGQLSKREGAKQLVIRTESNSTARKYFTLLKKTFNISSIMSAGHLSNRKKNRVYALTVDDPMCVDQLLQACRLSEQEGELQLADELVVQKDCCKRAFVRGAFLASGSVSDPVKTYHFEIVCADEKKADLLLGILSHFEIGARTVSRKQHSVVYIKDSSQVMDVLGLMGATDSMMQMQNVQILKSIRNQANRSVNCDTANIRKALRAAERQIEDIRLLQETGAFDDLPETLREIAQLRVTFPEATLADLGEMLDEPVGKSGVNHRLKKIAQIADKLKDGDKGAAAIRDH